VGLNGILVSFARARFVSEGAYGDSTTGVTVGRIFDENPVLHAVLGAEVLLFRPRIGQVVRGTVTSVGEGHVACLVAGLFNATILKEDMADGYIFDDTDASGLWLPSDTRGEAVIAAHAWSKTAAGRGAEEDDEEEEADERPGKKKRGRSSAATDASFNRILACNPETIRAGDSVVFRVGALSHSAGVVSIHGSFDDDHRAPTLPRKTPPGPVPIRRPSMPASQMRAAAAAAAARHGAGGDDDIDVDMEDPSAPAHKHRHPVGAGAGDAGADGTTGGQEEEQEGRKKAKKEKKEKKHKRRSDDE
jgi:hypothetical protein